MSYKPDESLLLRYIGASPTLRIIDFFLDNQLSDYSKNEIAKNLAMSRVTFFKYWKALEKSEAVKETRHVGRATMYRLDKRNDVVRQLIRLDMALARKAMEQAVEDHREPLAVRQGAR